MKATREAPPWAVGLGQACGGELLAYAYSIAKPAKKRKLRLAQPTQFTRQFPLSGKKRMRVPRLTGCASLPDVRSLARVWPCRQPPGKAISSYAARASSLLFCSNFYLPNCKTWMLRRQRPPSSNTGVYVRFSRFLGYKVW